MTECKLGARQHSLPSEICSDHSEQSLRFLCESMNLHPVKQLFQVAGAGDQTTDPWHARPGLYPFHHEGLTLQVKNETFKDKNLSSWMLKFCNPAVLTEKSSIRELFQFFWFSLCGHFMHLKQKYVPNLYGFFLSFFKAPRAMARVRVLVTDLFRGYINAWQRFIFPLTGIQLKWISCAWHLMRYNLDI